MKAHKIRGVVPLHVAAAVVSIIAVGNAVSVLLVWRGIGSRLDRLDAIFDRHESLVEGSEDPVP